MAAPHRVEFGAGMLAFLMICLTNCGLLQGSPAAAVESALRAGIDANVAPEAFRSGVLPADLAAAWTARAEAEYQRWFTGPALDQHLILAPNRDRSLLRLISRASTPAR